VRRCKTGKEQWGTPCRPFRCHAPLVAGGKIYFFSKDAKAIIVDASRDSGAEENTIGEEPDGLPAGAHGSLLYPHEGASLRIGA